LAVREQKSGLPQDEPNKKSASSLGDAGLLCILGVLPTGGVVMIAVHGTPIVAGDYENLAVLTRSTPDPNLGNNSVSAFFTAQATTSSKS
jgi:hypothetical protein